MALFQQLNKERNITVIYVTHEPDIAAHASRIIQMLDGAVLSDTRNEERLWASVTLENLKREANELEVPTALDFLPATS